MSPEKLTELSDAVAEMLRQVSDAFEQLGGSGRIALSFDWPVVVKLDNGRKFKSTVHVLWTEEGPTIPDPERQARRLVQEIEVLMR